MANLKWSEYDFVECLGVLPQFDEEWLEYSFKFRTNDLILEIFIIPYDSLVNITLAHESSDEPFLRFSFLVRGEVRYINEKNSAFLEFLDCIVSNFHNPDLFDKNKYPSYSTFEIHTFPKFQLKFS
jgi:hypothetical protein